MRNSLLCLKFCSVIRTATFQCIIDVALMRDNGDKQIERIGRLLKGRGIRVQFAGAAPTSAYQNYRIDGMRDLVARLRNEGHRRLAWLWPHAAERPGQHLSLAALRAIERLCLARSRGRRGRRGESRKFCVTRNGAPAPARAGIRRSIRNRQWRSRIYLQLTKLGSENGTGGPFGLTLKQYAEQLGVHTSDAAAEWLLANGVNSAIRMSPMDMNDEAVVEQIRDPMTVGNITDAGAHLQMLCGAGENVVYLTKYVREKKLITTEEAINSMTGKIATHFNLPEIGVVKPGKRADLVVFNLDEIEQKDMEKRYDVDDGRGGLMWRYTRPAAPMRLTMVNGTPIFRDGAYNGAKPGEYLEPSVTLAAE